MFGDPDKLVVEAMKVSPASVGWRCIGHRLWRDPDGGEHLLPPGQDYVLVPRLKAPEEPR